MLWRLTKDTTDICLEYRITGLAGEVAFYTLMSIPPLLLCVAGTLGYLDDLLGAGTIANVQRDILNASGTVLSPTSVNQLVRPLLHSVFSGGRPDLISVGFLLALWSGSRALYVFVDAVTIMYGLEGKRGIVWTRVLSLLLYIAALVVGSVVLPLVVAGPGLLVAAFPALAGLVHVLYWPVAVVLSVIFLTTLYHVSVPVRTPWREDLPGALVALLTLALTSVLLRIYLVHSIEGPSFYSTLAAPVAVLLWIAVVAGCVLVGAAVNASVDRLWPSEETAAARAESAAEREREATAAAEAAAARVRAAAAAAGPYEPGEDDAPSEFPERWAGFLPPSDLRSRLQPRGPRRGTGSAPEGGAGEREDERPESAPGERPREGRVVPPAPTGPAPRPDAGRPSDPRADGAWSPDSWPADLQTADRQAADRQAADRRRSDLRATGLRPVDPPASPPVPPHGGGPIGGPVGGSAGAATPPPMPRRAPHGGPPSSAN